MCKRHSERVPLPRIPCQLLVHLPNPQQYTVLLAGSRCSLPRPPPAVRLRPSRLRSRRTVCRSFEVAGHPVLATVSPLMSSANGRSCNRRTRRSSAYEESAQRARSSECAARGRPLVGWRATPDAAASAKASRTVSRAASCSRPAAASRAPAQPGAAPH